MMTHRDAHGAVPAVAGMSLRVAARTLHRSGFRVKIEGWGTAVSTNPVAGTPAAPGTTVVVRAEAGGAR